MYFSKTKWSLRDSLQDSFSLTIETSNYTGICKISPRFGKTLTVLNSLRTKEDWNIGISVPRESIINSWYKEMKIHNREFLNLSIVCSRSLSKLNKNLDLLVIDECQKLSEKEIEIIKSLAPKRLLFITGTLNSKKELLYHQEFKLKTIIEYSIEKAIDDEIIADYEINVIRCDLMPDERKQYDILTNNFMIYSNQAKLDRRYVFPRNLAARKRMHFIYNCTSKVKKVEEYIKTIDERYIVFSANTKVNTILANKNRYDSKYKESNLDKFINGEINSLGVINMCDMGLSFPDLKLGVIQQIQSNEEIFLQRALRCCNLDKGKTARIFIFVCKDTVDEKWLESCLKDINEKRIKYLD